MAISTKVIRRRIRSIGNTKKVTKAMEMVSAAKMRRSVRAVLSSRNYALTAWDTALQLAARLSQPFMHPLLQSRPEVKRLAVVLITSNRGLCGGFNSQVINTAQRYVAAALEKNPELQVNWISLGKKGSRQLVRLQRTLQAEFEKPDIVTDASGIASVARLLVKDFSAGTYDQVVVAYTDFISALSQKPRVKQLLPIDARFDSQLGSVGKAETPVAKKADQPFEYIFEPSPEKVLEQFLPRLVEIQLYQALLESNASEHSARMLAMRNAFDAATEMIDELTLEYNQARQASITREIAEIAGGKAALELA